MTRVLVIDDETPILRALRINLTARDYDVSTRQTQRAGWPPWHGTART